MTGLGPRAGDATSPQRPAARRRGFSLLELVVALGLSALVLTALMGLLVTTVRTQRRAQEEARLLRDAELVLLRLERDLSFAGTGLPPALAAKALRTPADDEEGGLALELLGDLPRPGALYPTLGLTVPSAGAGTRAAGRTDEGPPSLLMWRNEARPGACGDRPCPGALFVESGDAPTACQRTGSGQAEGGALQCPWSTGRVAVDEPLTVVTLSGDVGRARIAGPSPRLVCAAEGAGCELQLEGPVLTAKGAPVNTTGEPSWVTTPDVVRWVVREGVLLRQQCQAELDATGAQPTACGEQTPVIAGVESLVAERVGAAVRLTVALQTVVLGEPLRVVLVSTAPTAGWW